MFETIAEYSVIFRTGDYARIDRGIVHYEGRTDAQIKVRGHRVDLSEVEKAFTSVPPVDKAVVLCYKPGELSQVRKYKQKKLITNNNLQVYAADMKCFGIKFNL